MYVVNGYDFFSASFAFLIASLSQIHNLRNYIFMDQITLDPDLQAQSI